MRKDVSENRLDMIARGTGKGKVVETMEIDFFKVLEQVQAEDNELYLRLIAQHREADTKRRNEDYLTMWEIAERSKPLKLYDANTGEMTIPANTPETKEEITIPAQAPETNREQDGPSFLDGLLLAIGLGVMAVIVVCMAI